MFSQHFPLAPTGPSSADAGASPQLGAGGMTPELAAELHRQSLAAYGGASREDRHSSSSSSEDSSPDSEGEGWVMADEGRLRPGRNLVSIGHLTHE